MPLVSEDYKLAVGLNNTAGLTLVTSISDANGVALTMPLAVPFYSRGQLRVKSNGVAFRAGLKIVQWQMPLTLAQWTLLTGTYEGNVTVRTTTGVGTFANYNAILTVPDPVDLTYGNVGDSSFNAGAYFDVKLQFAILGTA